MPSQERDVPSRELELVRHQPALYESTRTSVPMYVASLIQLDVRSYYE